MSSLIFRGEAMDFEIITGKFHKIILRKYKLCKIKPKNQTLRNLLCYYQALACQKYPTEDVFNIFQQEAYDMRYTVSVSTIGTYSALTYTLQAVDPRYIDDEAYTYSFLEEAFKICMEPVIVKDNFDLKTFRHAKEIYASNLLYQEENDARLAKAAALHTFFKGTIRDFQPDGDLKSLERITCKRLYRYYLTVVEEEEASYAVGNVLHQYRIENHATITPKYNHFFRKRGDYPAYVYNPKETGQTYLEIIYDTKIFPNHKLFYAVSFLNFIFGGCSNSKLFTLVREKYGLCYSISSTHFGASGIILVSAILDYKDKDRAIQAVDEAFDTLLDEVNIADIKAYFLSEKKGRADYLLSYLNDDFMDRYFMDSVPSGKEEELLNRITPADMKAAYRKMKKALVYVYGGERLG